MNRAVNNIKETPLVSIIVITYNSAKFIIETLESTRVQTYKNLELIISDDCSNDNTVEICKLWINVNEHRFKNIRLITTSQNTGIPANCNRGVKAANGEWVKLIAGDDSLIETCILDNVDYICKNKFIKVLQSDFNIYNDNIAPEGFKAQSNFGVNPFFDYRISAQEQYKLLLHKNRVSACTIFLKRSIINQFGGFDEDFRLIEDYPFWLRLTKSNIKIHYFPKITVNYRVHNMSVRKVKPFMNENYAKERLYLIKKYLWREIGYIDYIKYKMRFILIILLNKLELNKKTILSQILFKIITKLGRPS